jgi:hypothetical protein
MRLIWLFFKIYIILASSPYAVCTYSYLKNSNLTVSLTSRIDHGLQRKQGIFAPKGSSVQKTFPNTTIATSPAAGGGLWWWCAQGNATCARQLAQHFKHFDRSLSTERLIHHIESMFLALQNTR